MVRLMTDRRQERAARFYQRLGFEFIGCPEEDDEDLCMEMVL